MVVGKQSPVLPDLLDLLVIQGATSGLGLACVPESAPVVRAPRRGLAMWATRWPIDRGSWAVLLARKAPAHAGRSAILNEFAPPSASSFLLRRAEVGRLGDAA
eukprot:8724804-Pyramimonas_sp.AAC.1